MRGLLKLGYLVAGVVLAQQHGYFAHLSSLSTAVSAALAVLLWPLLLGGANLHVHLDLAS